MIAFNCSLRIWFDLGQQLSAIASYNEPHSPYSSVMCFFSQALPGNHDIQSLRLRLSGCSIVYTGAYSMAPQSCNSKCIACSQGGQTTLPIYPKTPDCNDHRGLVAFASLLGACATLATAPARGRVDDVATFDAGLLQNLICHAAKCVGVDTTVRLSVFQPFIYRNTHASKDRHDRVVS